MTKEWYTYYKPYMDSILSAYTERAQRRLLREINTMETDEEVRLRMIERLYGERQAVWRALRRIGSERESKAFLHAVDLMFWSAHCDVSAAADFSDLSGNELRRMMKRFYRILAQELGVYPRTDA